LLTKIGTRKLNPKWDSLLTPSQKEILTQPGFGIVQDLPYLKEEDVAEVMAIIGECIKHVKLMIEN
jgi:hypothetical protein